MIMNSNLKGEDIFEQFSNLVGSGGNVDLTDGGGFTYPHPSPAPAPSPAVPNHALAPITNPSHQPPVPSPGGTAIPNHSLAPTLNSSAPEHPIAPTPVPNDPRAPAAPQHSLAPTPGPLAPHALAHLPHHPHYSGHHYPSTSAMAAYQSHMMSQMTWYQVKGFFYFCSFSIHRLTIIVENINHQFVTRF